MDIRDKNIEEQIRESSVNIPESLLPENIEKKIMGMEMDEKYSRSQSADIPADISGGRGKRSMLLPVVLAAALTLALGLGIGLAINGNGRNNNRSYKKKQSTGVTSTEYGSNYENAYSSMKQYKDHIEEMNDMVLDYETDIVEESADADMTNTANTIGAELGEVSKGTAQSTDYTDTNVRTEGVGEADIVKTDGRYIYEYDSYTEHLVFYSVEDGSIEKVGRINVLQDDYSFSEMYIYGDRLILLGTDTKSSYYDTNAATVIRIYDISDKGEPEYVDEIRQAGWYDTSRMVDGALYTFSRKSFDLDKLSRKKYDTYIPEVDGELLEDDELFIENNVYQAEYEVVTSVDVDKAEIIDRLGVYGGSTTVYMSGENIYFVDYQYDWTTFTYKDSGVVARISYDDGDMVYEAKGNFPGNILNDYSIDEYDGYLRLVTTYRDTDYVQKNGLYILDMNLDKVSVIKGLGEGETIKSARFMGDTGYFVTFRNTDPLFAVDLSDPENPEIMDYLKIPGFSAYLHPYGEDRMLGIGYDTNENGIQKSIKLTMFDTSDPTDIRELDTKVIYDYRNASVLNDRNALMYNQNDGSFGFASTYEWDLDEWEYDYEYMEEYYGDDYLEGIDTEKEIGEYYQVYTYDEDKGFICRMDEMLDDSASYMDVNNTRGIVIGDYLYVVTPGVGIASYDTDDYRMVEELY